MRSGVSRRDGDGDGDGDRDGDIPLVHWDHTCYKGTIRCVAKGAEAPKEGAWGSWIG